MKYSWYFIVNTYIIILTVNPCSCWQFFTSLVDHTLSNSMPDERHIHSEYFYGDCKRKTMIFYTHVHLDHLAVLGKIIIRGWIDIRRIPTCILLRGTSFYEDMFRSTAYNFQICVPRISYCHTHHRYKYYYYEWYIPVDMIGGMNWDLYFFGPENLEWQ